MTRDERTEQRTDVCLSCQAENAGSHLQDHLTGILAHELRHPLAAVLTSLHVLRQEGVDEAAARAARERAERQAWYMARIIEDMLDICRGRHGKLQLRKERVDLADVVTDALDAARPFLSRRKHHLIVSLPPQPVSLVADAARLAQILTNLLTNAGRYTDSGGEIHLSAEVAGGVVVLRVRDNGLGIAADVLPRIFDLFQQGDPSHSSGSGGLGIGLALVKVLVEMHGGIIAASSQGPGTGSEFVVRFPSCAPIFEEGRAAEGLATALARDDEQD